MSTLKVVVITGVSPGIGRAAAMKFAAKAYACKRWTQAPVLATPRGK